MRKVVPAAALALVIGASLAPEQASAHGRRYYDNPPIIVVPPGHQAHPYPYWYYSRPQPRYHAPPVIVVPPPRHYYYDRPHWPHHRHHGPGATFYFRF